MPASTVSFLHRLGALILVLGAATALVHFLLVAFYAPLFPPSIPAFVDPAGKPVVSLDRSPLSLLRLPLMGLAGQAVCLAIWTTRLKDAESWAANRLTWASVALIVGCKMLLSTLDLLAFQDPQRQVMFRTGVIAMSVLGVAALLPGVIKLHAGYGRTPAAYAGQVGPRARVVLVVAGLVYIALVAMPWWPFH